VRKLSLTVVMALVFGLAITLNPSSPVKASPAEQYSGTHFGAGNLPAGCENDVLVGDLTLTPIPQTQVLDPKAANNVCHHMRTDMNALDSPQIDVLVMLPLTPAVERDMRIMRQAVEMWEGGIDYLAPQMGMQWMADGVDFHVTVDYFDPVGGNGGEFTTEPVVDPEIVVIGALNPVGVTGIGIDPVANTFVNPNGPLPCLPVDNPFDIEQWEALPGFNDHHQERSGTYNEDCGDTDGGQSGGNVCFAVNTALDPAPGTVELASLFDLVAHEFGHCLTVGHVGDGAEGWWAATPTNDIMAYHSDPPGINKCVSTLDVEGLATVMSRYLDVDGDGVAGNNPLVANDQAGQGGNPFQVQHPRDHLYASSTGAPLDCPQPDLGLVPGEPTDWTPTPVAGTGTIPACGPTDPQVTDVEGDATGVFLAERGVTPTSEDSLDITSGYLTWDATAREVLMHIKLKNLEAVPTAGAATGEYFRFTFNAAGGWQASAKREPNAVPTFALGQLNELGTQYATVATLKGSFDADTDEVVIRVPATPYNEGDKVPAWTKSMNVTGLEITAQRSLVRATSTTDVGRGLCKYSVGQEVVQNGAPVARDDDAATARNGGVAIAVLANDTDPDGDALQIVTATSPSNGTATLNGDGTITYTPRRGFAGVDRFTYVVDDMRGGTDEAVVTVNVSKK
jgi:hypothetical protein